MKREEAIEYGKEWLKDEYLDAKDGAFITIALEALEQEPIQPKANVGRWISIYGNVKCSVCGNTKDGRSVGKATHYCDFCGAKIESEE